ncbi:MAG: hypothetical protein LBR36_04320 [Bacteroidales bacterium]|nr:hypothetical protein [Bacteroidales bacterium]
MNKLKVIILIAAVTVAVAVGIAIMLSGLGKQKEISLPKNQFTAKIEQEIEQLKAKPDNKFCQDFYKEVAYHINDFYKQNRFGTNQSENDQWKENFDKILYSTYAEKFINQTFVVLRGSAWNTDDLKFIQAEKNELKKSKLLVAGSPVDKSFSIIQTALNKYGEIVGFISQCKGYGYSGTVLSDRFPIAEVQSKISRAVTLRSNRLENEYVNNCARLHDELKICPKWLFDAHIKYLSNKIGNWSGLYSNYNSQKEYKELLYDKLKAEIDLLDNSVYIDIGESVVDREYDQLKAKLDSDSRAAYNYFSNKTN